MIVTPSWEPWLCVTCCAQCNLDTICFTTCGPTCPALVQQSTTIIICQTSSKRWVKSSWQTADFFWWAAMQGRSTHHDTPMLNAIKQWGKGHWQVLRARKTSKAVTDNDPTLFIDSVHFWRPVYALLNIELLQMLSEPC